MILKRFTPDGWWSQFQWSHKRVLRLGTRNGNRLTLKPLVRVLRPTTQSPGPKIWDVTRPRILSYDEDNVRTWVFLAIPRQLPFGLLPNNFRPVYRGYSFRISVRFVFRYSKSFSEVRVFPYVEIPPSIRPFCAVSVRSKLRGLPFLPVRQNLLYFRSLQKRRVVLVRAGIVDVLTRFSCLSPDVWYTHLQIFNIQFDCLRIYFFFNKGRQNGLLDSLVKPSGPHVNLKPPRNLRV